MWNSPLEDKQAELRRACAHYKPENPERCFCVMDASFRHDSGWSTVAIGKKYNNPGNHRCPSSKSDWHHNMSCVPHSSKASWGSPTGPWAKYPTLEDGIWGNVALYARKYKTQDAEYFMSVWVQTADKDSDYANAIRACFSS